jgi:cytochrome c oxidase subunit 2
VTPLDQHVLVPKGPQAAHIAELWWFYLGVLGVVTILVWAFVLIALFKRDADSELGDAPRLTSESLAELPPPARPLGMLDPAQERRKLRAVLLASGATVVVLFVLLAESIATGSLLADSREKPALHIQVTGNRWWWSVRYPASIPSQTFTTANEIHIPVGRPVRLELASNDVIHSFWVPNLHGKRDLVPGRRTTLTIQADTPGKYRGQCAEFCGYSHAQMALWVIAEPPAAFEAWRAAQQRTPPAPSSELTRRGQAVFLSGPCVMCHSIAGTIAQSNVGPDLSHVASRISLAAGSLPNTRGNLAGWLLNAPHLKPGVAMPSISLEAEDLHALLAYLETLE